MIFADLADLYQTIILRAAICVGLAIALFMLLIVLAVIGIARWVSKGRNAPVEQEHRSISEYSEAA